ncbi:MAG: transporter [Caldilinea sp. CFX5]|nr:transporter [Caldilinea sp. CFX5]
MEILRTIVTAVITFAATNIDDLFVLMLFYAQTNATFTRWHVVIRQYLGFTALVAISLLGFVGGLLIPREWIGLLGVLPIAIGLRHWWQHKQEEDTPAEQAVAKTSVMTAILSVAAVTFANGGDNIGIYTPLFATSDLPRLLIILLIFYLLVGVWCVVSYFLTHHKLVAKALTEYGHRIVPFVLIGLGVYILVESEAYTLFWVF